MIISFFRMVLLLILFSVPISLISAQSVSGLIRDGESGVPLENVNIQLLDTPLGTSSGQDGTYLLNLPAGGQFIVYTTMVGYKPVKIAVDIPKDSLLLLDITLYPTVLQVKPIEVTAQKYRDVVDSPKLESPALYTAISVVKKDEIQKQGAKTLTESMQYIPGGHIETRGRKVKQFFSIRGQTYPYPEYAVNGAWQREFHELPYFYPSSEVERIEIVRSSAALLTGLNGLVGIIKVDTRLYESPETSYLAEYGTFNSYRMRLSHGSKTGNLSYATGISLQGTEGPEDKNAAEKIGSLYGRLVWKPSEQFDVDFNIYHLNGYRELSLAEPPATNRLQTVKSKYDPYKATLYNLKVFYKPSLKTSSELLLTYSDRDPVYIDEGTQDPVSTSEADHEFGLNFIQTLTPFNDNTLRFGGLYNHWVAPNGKRFYSGRRSDLETFSLVAVDEHRFGNLALDAGLRWARTYINEFGAFNIEGVAGGFARVEPVVDTWEPGVFSGSLGGVYYFDSPYSIHLNLSAGQIKPREGAITETFEKPQNEERLKFDLGIQTIAKNIGQLTLTGFFVKQKNAIVLSDTVHIEDGYIQEYYLNRDQDQAGIEFEARSDLWFNSVECFINILYMSSRFAEDGRMEINYKLPEFITSAGVYFNASDFDINLFAKYVSAYENARFAAGVNGQPPQPQPLGDYLLINSTFGKTFGSTFRTRIYFEIQNLTDVRYATVVGYPDFGRKFIVGISQVFH